MLNELMNFIRKWYSVQVKYYSDHILQCPPLKPVCSQCLLKRSLLSSFLAKSIAPSYTIPISVYWYHFKVFFMENNSAIFRFLKKLVENLKKLVEREVGIAFQELKLRKCLNCWCNDACNIVLYSYPSPTL